MCSNVNPIHTEARNEINQLSKNDSLLAQLITYYGEYYQNGERKTNKGGDFARLIRAKVDDAWAATESAESLLKGQIKSSQYWARLSILRLRIFADHPIENEFRTLASRRQSKVRDELRKLLRTGFAVRPSDAVWRLHLTHYFSKAWTRNEIAASMLEEADIESLLGTLTAPLSIKEDASCGKEYATLLENTYPFLKKATFSKS